MPTTQLPLAKGLGKDFRNADYVDLLPVNMLATPKEVLNASGYLRSFPGVEKTNDVSGTSRGAQFNTSQNSVYRVQGSTLYRDSKSAGSVPGFDRVSMAFSATSQAVANGGVMTLYRYDGEVKNLSNWPDTGFTQYDIGYVRDICRLRGRYIWVKEGSGTFGVTDLEDESHPDRFRPFYAAESQPDGIQGCAVWRDFVVMFGTSTIEYFYLTGATDTSAAIYVAQPSWMVQKGIAGTYCKAIFGDSFAFLSHQSTGAPSVYIVNSGQASPIASASIEKILREYTAEELSTGVMEALRFDAHELLVIHLPRHVLCYDASASQNGPQWSILKTGLADKVYRGIDFIFEGNKITLGDKIESVTGALKFDISSQYGNQSEHVLYTPMFKADNARVFDFELEAATGVSQFAERLFVSATVDGSSYGREQMIPWNAPFRYDSRAIWKRVGRVRKNIGFKIRIVTRSPVTLSDCSVRVE
ncbi:packaged DNA stabilization protein [Yersinia vastinensis]|uniref:packaged DNA stabilization protein n=1 Tax=Yersinia vastinensis TaxID=2890318 RepID=UPI0011A2FE4F|nr:packaged DNA stabilization protein [Yersinia vastinensis]